MKRQLFICSFLLLFCYFCAACHVTESQIQRSDDSRPTDSVSAVPSDTQMPTETEPAVPTQTVTDGAGDVEPTVPATEFWELELDVPDPEKFPLHPAANARRIAKMSFYGQYECRYKLYQDSFGETEWLDRYLESRTAFLADDRLDAWFDKQQAIADGDFDKVGDERNFFTVSDAIILADITEEEFVSWHQDYCDRERSGVPMYTAEQIEALYSGDQGRINRAFRYYTAIEANGTLYSPHWFETHSINEWRKAGVLPRQIEEQLIHWDGPMPLGYRRQTDFAEKIDRFLTDGYNEEWSIRTEKGAYSFGWFINHDIEQWKDTGTTAEEMRRMRQIWSEAMRIKGEENGGYSPGLGFLGKVSLYISWQLQQKNE